MAQQWLFMFVDPTVLHAVTEMGWLVPWGPSGFRLTCKLNYHHFTLLWQHCYPHRNPVCSYMLPTRESTGLTRMGECLPSVWVPSSSVCSLALCVLCEQWQSADGFLSSLQTLNIFPCSLGWLGLREHGRSLCVGCVWKVWQVTSSRAVFPLAAWVMMTATMLLLCPEVRSCNFIMKLKNMRLKTWL